MAAKQPLEMNFPLPVTVKSSLVRLWAGPGMLKSQMHATGLHNLCQPGLSACRWSSH